MISSCIPATRSIRIKPCFEGGEFHCEGRPGVSRRGDPRWSRHLVSSMPSSVLLLLLKTNQKDIFFNRFFFFLFFNKDAHACRRDIDHKAQLRSLSFYRGAVDCDDLIALLLTFKDNIDVVKNDDVLFSAYLAQNGIPRKRSYNTKPVVKRIELSEALSAEGIFQSAPRAPRHGACTARWRRWTD